MMQRLLPALLLLAPLATLHAQHVDNPFQVLPCNVDTGFLDNPGTEPLTIQAGRVHLPEALWLRLHLNDSHIPAGSRLKITAAHDGAVQWFEMGSLRDYQFRSAFFNAGDVSLELILGPGTRGNRIVCRNVEAGQLGMPAPLSICGTVDDRILSSDPRQGRQHPSGCTSWLISAATVMTAGHCTTNSSQAIHFQVPLSTGSGGLVLPPPEHQYPYDPSTMQRLSSGVGSDWAVVTTVRNSNTGLYAGQRQGGWYELGPVPASTSGQVIRITGYGTVSSPVSPTWRQVQKTHTGSLSQIRATSLCYATDTTGGNSGSPIIHENTGLAIGIHTHGGCTATSGCNSGTRIDRTDLQAAIAALIDRRKAGRFDQIGTGCVSSSGAATLTTIGFPDQGATFQVQMSGLPAGQVGALILGGSNTSWNGLTLPFDLGAMGAPGCVIRTSVEVALDLPTGSGTPSTSVTVPRVAVLIGQSFFLQYVATDPSANALGLVLTNAVQAMVGD